LLSPFAVTTQPLSLHPAHPVLHTLPPSMQVRDKDDLKLRVRNYYRSMKACPVGWRGYFETLAQEIGRELN
jgi:hypothetical protein